MGSDKIVFRYHFNLRDENSHAVIDYFKNGEFNKYMGSEQNISICDTREIDGRDYVFSINSDMRDISKVLSPENKFIPQEVSCDNPNCYSFVECILKSNMGDKSRLKRNLINRIMNRASIKLD